jgi:phosphoglucosamine mutase
MSGRLFGTDGIRGTANRYPITAEMAMKFGMAAGHLFTKDEYRHRVLIAKDTRLSGYLIEHALTSGFISVGIDVILVGPMPTAAVPMLMRALRADMGVMISASHNLYQDNGLKLFGKNGHKLSDDYENKLQALMLGSNLDDFLVAPEKLGRAKRLEDAHGRYMEHVKRSFPKGLSLAGMRIVIDCAHGAAYHIAPQILWELGAEVVKIGCEPDGFNINQHCGSTSPELLIEKVKETRADIGIALDGDADRVMICDETGKIVSGDHVIGLIAASMLEQGTLRGNGVVITQMSNTSLDKYLNTLGLEAFRSQIGDRYVAEKMKEKKCNFGGEQSGHIIIDDYSTTGDGTVAALQVLACIAKSKKPISSIAYPFKLNPQLTKNIRYRDGNPLEDKKLQAHIAEVEKKYKDTRVLVRKSGTEKLIRVMVESISASKINSIISEIESLVLKVV